mmetsp:Transcript_50817/g.90792  ORF Transcript_50817/g.90792 Transcript_50817/m.90792 type:complete len:200 (+) Transcript_50817:80-679(+)
MDPQIGWGPSSPPLLQGCSTFLTNLPPRPLLEALPPVSSSRKGPGRPPAHPRRTSGRHLGSRGGRNPSPGAPHTWYPPQHPSRRTAVGRFGCAEGGTEILQPRRGTPAQCTRSADLLRRCVHGNTGFPLVGDSADVMEHVRLRGVDHARRFKGIREASRKGKNHWEACRGNRGVVHTRKKTRAVQKKVHAVHAQCAVPL